MVVNWTARANACRLVRNTLRRTSLHTQSSGQVGHRHRWYRCWRSCRSRPCWAVSVTPAKDRAPPALWAGRRFGPVLGVTFC